MGKVCAFFGHGTIYKNIEQKIRLQIEKLIIEENVDTFWVGGYGEFDMIAAHIVRSLQENYPEISLILIIAYVRQLHSYGEVLPFDGFDYPVEAEAAMPKFAISARNRYMAKNCDIALTYVLNEYGGAYEAMKIAKNNHKLVINLANK